GAAAVGAFTSLPAALGGGLLIGVSYQIALGVTSNAGTSELVVFLVIMGIVIVRGGAIGRVFSTAGAIVEDRAPLRIPEAIRDRLSVRYTPRAALAGALVLGLLIPFVPIIAPDWLFHKSWFGSAQPFGLVLNPPSLATGLGSPSSQLVTYFVALGVVVVGGAAMWALRRSQPGRLIIAVRDDEKRAATFRVTPTTIKMGALCISGFLAGAAGVLWADAWRDVTAAQFPADLSLAVLAAVVIGGIGSVTGAVAGG